MMEQLNSVMSSMGSDGRHGSSPTQSRLRFRVAAASSWSMNVVMVRVYQVSAAASIWDMTTARRTPQLLTEVYQRLLNHHGAAALVAERRAVRNDHRSDPHAEHRLDECRASHF